MKWFICCLLAILLFGCQDNASSLIKTDELPNIILIMSDDQGWGDTGYNDHPHLKTPHLDEMAANSVEFTRFYAASAVCSPTRGSVLTGRHPMRYGICYANCGHMLPEEITIAEMVKEKGYTTGHFGKWHLGTLSKTEKDANRGGRLGQEEHYSPPWDNGFDVCFSTESKVPTWDPLVTPPRSAEDVNVSMEEGQYFGTAYWTGPETKEEDNLLGDDSRVIMDRVLPFIEEAILDQRPFLSVIWFHTPHLPVLTGEKYRSLYSNLSLDQQHYYGCISAMDEQVGRLRKHLRNLGIEENTVLFFTSDNGPEGKRVEGRKQGLTNGLTGRKRSLQEGGIRVPGIMEWPGVIKGAQKINVPCFTSDYFPTVAKMLGIDISRNCRPYDGIPLQDVLKNPHMERFLPFRIEDQAALVGNQFKIYSKDDGKSFTLYDLVKDPAETVGQEDLHPELFSTLEDKWNNWKVSQENSADGNDYLE